MTFRTSDQFYDLNNSQLLEHNNQNDPTQHGFEPMDYEAKYPFEMKDLEITGYPSMEERIKDIAIKNATIVIVTESNRIFRWRQNKENKCQEYFLPDLKGKINQFKDKLLKKLHMDVKDQRQGIERIYMDNLGNHVLLTNSDGNNYYFNDNLDQIKHIPQLNYIIKSGVFQERPSSYRQSTMDNSDINNTPTIIFGTNDGQILQSTFEVTSDEISTVLTKDLVQLYSQKSINNLYMLYFEQKNQSYHSLLLATTHSSIYYFFANNQSIPLTAEQIIYKNYMTQNMINNAELPFPRAHTSLIDICYSMTSVQDRPHSLLFTNGYGLNAITFPNAEEDMDEIKLKTFVVYNYQKKEEESDEIILQMKSIPTQICLSRYHYYILDRQGLTILSRITQKIVHFQDLRLMDRIIGMIQDSINDCIWLYSEREVRKIDLDLEDFGVWRVYLEAEQYKQAYESCLVSQEEYSQYIGKIYAEHLIKKGDYKQASKIFLQCDIPFEQSLLMLVSESIQNKQCIKACDYYLKYSLKKIAKQEDSECQKQILMNLVLQFRVQLLLSIQQELKHFKKNANNIEKYEELKRDLAVYNESIQKFLREYSEEINEDSAFQILQSHGFIDLMILFCELKGKLEMVIMHNINEEQYSQAMMNMKKLDQQQMKQNAYKYSHILMEHEPQKMKYILCKKIKEFDPTKILSSLFNIPKEHMKEAADILEHCIVNIKSQQSIHNAYIFFLSELKHTDQIQQYLEVQYKHYRKTFNWPFNLDFAFNSFFRNKLYKNISQIYGMIELWSDAVNLALETDELEQAKTYARKVRNESQSKRLWMQIVHYMRQHPDKYTVQQIIDLTDDNIEENGSLLRYSDQTGQDFTMNKNLKQKSVLKIDEIIPYFDQNMKIELFQGKISKSLQQYNQEIRDLKEQMEQYSIQAESCQRELVFIKDSFFQTDTQQQCEYCNKKLFQNKEYFYIFPCLHGYHQSCFFKILKQHKSLRPEYKQIIQDIQQLNQKLNDIKYRKKRKQQQRILQEQQQNIGFFEKYFGGENHHRNSSEISNSGLIQNSNSINKDSFNSQNNSSQFRNSQTTNSTSNTITNTQNNNTPQQNNNAGQKISNQNNSDLRYRRGTSIIEEEHIEDLEEEEMNVQIAEIKKIKEKHDQIVAKECLKCGFIGVDMIHQEFNKTDQFTWEI